MKKAWVLALAALLALPLVVPTNVNAADPAPALEGPGVKSAVVFNNGEKLTLEEKTTIKGGRVFVPLRELTEKFGLHLKYDAATNTAYILDKEDATLAKAEKGESMNLFRNDVKLETIVDTNAENKAFVSAVDFAEALGRYYYEDTLSNSLYMFDDAAPMKDGEYVAVGLASRGWVPQVNLTVKGGKIESVVYNEYNAEGNGKKTDEAYNTSWQAKYPEVILSEKIDTLQSDLVAKQDPNKVDVTTGATGTHQSFVALTKKAMAQAKAASVSKAVNFDYKDGKYVVVGLTDSRGWTPQVDMEVKDGKIISVEYTALNDKGESKRLDGAGYVTNWKNKYEGVDPVAIIAEREAQLIKTQDPNMVDVATGATGWGDDLKLFTVGALNQARMSDIEVTEGSTIYVFHGEPTAKSAYYIQLLALAKDNKIVDVDYVEYQTGSDLAKPHNPTYIQNWANKTPDVLQGRNQLDIKEEMQNFLLNNKTVEGIDTITGASNWRKGIVELGPKAVKMIEK
ncbi:hypothetical protein KQI88_12025 [Alkaliphilus sp. MSJ-5]|uniref:FMN-binding domain-containing protein n=1 Tax=Alkaliphilus flagellatus TaxID=2841507 RepID=A0ABS6G3T2_9FIRM|nr:stalk domain-containing protein [Alkaliphilus flagellatus]MBU5677139.1 hypothetical protein [Alkaliphilus flagellatus]